MKNNSSVSYNRCAGSENKLAVYLKETCWFFRLILFYWKALMIQANKTAKKFYFENCDILGCFIWLEELTKVSRCKSKCNKILKKI